MEAEMDDRIREKLEFIYGKGLAVQTVGRLKSLTDRWKEKLGPVTPSSDSGIPADQRDSIMITYGDNIRKPGMEHLEALKNFADEKLTGVVSGIHILPFSPYSSDDGFSVMDYRQVNPDWGNWGHITAIAKNFRLMADLVLNHCSAQGAWFKSFLAGKEAYADYFITVEPGVDLSGVFPASGPPSYP